MMQDQSRENWQAVEACEQIGAREGDYVVVHGDRATVFHTVPTHMLTPEVMARLVPVRPAGKVQNSP